LLLADEPASWASRATAARDRLRIGFRYTSHDGTQGGRAAEPHQLVHTGRRWYLLAWDLARGDWRTFRADRITSPQITGPRFIPRDPPGGDPAEFEILDPPGLAEHVLALASRLTRAVDATAALARHLQAVPPACDAARVAGANERTPTAQWSRLVAGRSDDLGPRVLRGVGMKTPPIVSPQEWEAARQELLVKEKELTRARDALAAERRRMPWLALDKAYQFEGPDGMASLLDLFDGRRQLIVYRAFYGPEVTTYAEGGSYPERACVGCSMVADQVAHPAHLNARDTTLVFASRAPQAEIQGLKQRHGWEHIPWYTITDDFDKDFDVDEWHGTNAFVREGDRIFRTYLINARGDEQMGSTWNYLDMTALGRQEQWEDSPEGYPQTPPYAWWNYHDAYPEGR
jgi:predicted dithiol-disulfide oxidoreductase (DUF899 family)